MQFRISKCLSLSLFICIYIITIAETTNKGDTEETPNQDSDDAKSVSVATDEPSSEIFPEAAVTEKKLGEFDKALAEVSKDLAKPENITEELETESSKEKQNSDEKSDSSTEETSTSVLETTDSKEKSDAITSSSPIIPTATSIKKQEAPKDTFAVWNSKGKICLLAKFNATFSIVYASEGGEQKAEVSLPADANVKGKCETTTSSPLMQISWQKYVFSMMFNKTEEEDNWVVTSMELSYDTSEGLFDRATNVGKKTARSKVLSIFETPMKRSHFCPAHEVVLMYTGNKQVVTAKLHNVNLQPYDVEDAKFSPAYRCNKVVLDEESLVQDETVPLAVGLTLALITLFVLVGFSVHRAYNAAKVDYNTMP